jgi:phosphomannomutase / phosphoglucomutase
MLKPGIFREYDIRGVADAELVDEDVERLGRALATYIIRHSGRIICVGRDCRLSGERIHDALVKGMLSVGTHVLDLGVVPTPVLYFSTYYFRADGAVMITGSHNPPEYNGFKAVSGVEPLYGLAIQDLYRLIMLNDFDTGEGDVRSVDALNPYVDEIASQFALERKVNVVVDAANGTAGPVIRQLFRKLNVHATEMFFDMDGSFPNHQPDPTHVSNLRALQERVRERNAELGIAFDGDADRIGVVDENGNIVHADMLLLMFGRDILSRKPGSTFIGEVKCSQVMYDKLKELGGNPIMYRAGHSLIKAKMKQEHAQLAGEMSGHIFFADRYYGYDDAIYAACRLLEIVAKSGRALSHQLDGIPQQYSTPELRLECPDELKFRLVEKVSEILRKEHPVIEIDGVRVSFEDGWALVRASNTQPVLVMRFEASSKQSLEKYRHEVQQALDQAKKDLFG